MTHGYATQARCFHVKYTHKYILYTHTTMRYRCEILNHGIDGYEVWLHGRNQGRSGVNGLNIMPWISYLNNLRKRSDTEAAKDRRGEGNCSKT